MIRWIPGHEGIYENERADEQAKRVAEGDSSLAHLLPRSCRGHIPIRSSVACQGHLRKIKTKATEIFAASPRYSWMKQIDTSMPSLRFRKDTQGLSCAQATLLVQLRTGYVSLQKHLHKTLHHYLMIYPVHGGPRSQMEKVLH